VTGLPVATPDGHTGAVRSVSLAPDGATVLTGGADGIARTWDATTGPLLTFAGHDGRVLGAELSADGTTVATVGQDDHTVRLWGAQTGETAAVIAFDDAAPLAAMFAPGGRTLATVDTDGAVQLVDVPTGTVRLRLDAGRIEAHDAKEPQEVVDRARVRVRGPQHMRAVAHDGSGVADAAVQQLHLAHRGRGYEVDGIRGEALALAGRAAPVGPRLALTDSPAARQPRGRLAARRLAAPRPTRVGRGRRHER